MKVYEVHGGIWETILAPAPLRTVTLHLSLPHPLSRALPLAHPPSLHSGYVAVCILHPPGLPTKSRDVPGLAGPVHEQIRFLISGLVRFFFKNRSGPVWSVVLMKFVFVGFGFFLEGSQAQGGIPSFYS